MTTPTVVESVNTTNLKVSGPSVVPSRVIDLVTVATPRFAPALTIVNDPEFGAIKSAPTALVPDAPCSVL